MGKSEVNILLKSKEGNQFTLKRSNKNFISLYSNATLKVENIKLNGDNKAQAVGVTGGTLTLGNGAVIENCTGYQNFDGPAIYINGGTLNVLEGAIIQNNKYSLQGGAIQARNNSTVNISGGTFKNNKSERDGGAIAAYGPLNITGGILKKIALEIKILVELLLLEKIIQQVYQMLHLGIIKLLQVAQYIALRSLALQTLLLKIIQLIGAEQFLHQKV